MAYLDGELAPSDARAVEAHLGACAVCAREAEGLRGGRDRLRAALHDPAADAEARAAAPRVRERLRRRSSAPYPVPPARRPPASRPLPWARRSRILQAALFVLFLAGGASALVPGSPLRRWIEGSSAPQERAPAPLSPPPQAAEAPQVSLSAAPAGGALRVVLDLPSGTELRVSLVDDGRATVFAAPDTRFRSAEGLLEASVAQGSVRVELPRGGTDVSLEVGGEVYLRIRDGRLDLPVPATDSSAAELSFRIR
jgi:hypothetical protein